MWNMAAPRVGLTFDLGGDGKTVVKANYGLYWHNPGVTVPDTGNPNTASKSATYAWNDTNGDRRWQPGEQGTQVTASLEGAIGVGNKWSGSRPRRCAHRRRYPCPIAATRRTRSR